MDFDIMRVEGPYKSANQQRRLVVRTKGYTKTQSKIKKVTCNSFCTTPFTYKIRYLDPLTEILLLPHYNKHYFLIHYTENIANYNTLSTTFYIDFQFLFIHS
jgi:hypothetical protein